jgi:uncharacterized protein (TIGR03382 family)
MGPSAPHELRDFFEHVIPRHVVDADAEDAPALAPALVLVLALVLARGTGRLR